MAFCREHPGWTSRCRSEVVFGEELPKTSTGKIQKYILRKEAKGYEPHFFESSARKAAPAKHAEGVLTSALCLFAGLPKSPPG